MTTSRAELMQQDWVSYVQTIRTGTADNYRTDPKQVLTTFTDIEKLTEFPQVSVLLGPEQLQRTDDPGQAMDGRNQVWLLGYARQDVAEDLLHDLKRVAVKNIFTMLNDAANPWQVSMTRTPTFNVDRQILEGTDLAWVGVWFEVLIRNQASVTL